MAEQQCQGQCPILAVQNMISGKWKIIILWCLKKKTPRRFNEFMKILPDISQGVLTQQLRELERSGLVYREVYKEVPPKVEYSLTELGQSFMPLYDAINEWGKDYMEKIREAD